MDILVLGGTGRGRQLASALQASGCDVTTSLAGRTASPLPVAGKVRVGGFGGPAGLTAFLREHRPRAVVDATHAFAATMSKHASQACAATGVPLLRFEAPSWRGLEAAGTWIWVPDHTTAAASLAALPGPVLLTVGRQPIAHYLGLAERDVRVRVVDPPELELPAAWTLIQDLGPFPIESERDRLADVAVLASKDAGGEHLDAKLQAAAELGVAVVMLERPPVPDGLRVLPTLDAVLAALSEC